MSCCIIGADASKVKQDDCKSNTDTLAPESHDKFLFLRSVAFLTLKRQSNTSRHLLIALDNEVRMVVFVFFFFFPLLPCFFCRGGQRDRGRRASRCLKIIVITTCK